MHQTYVHLFLDSQVYSISLHNYAYASTTLFWIMQICRSFEIEKRESSNLALLQVCFNYLKSLVMPYNFKTMLFISPKGDKLDFDMGYIAEYYILKNIKSLYMNMVDISGGFLAHF